MIILLLFLFLTVIAFCFVPIKENSSAFIILAVLGLSCFLLVSFRGGNVDNDYKSYKELFNRNGVDLHVEPTFLLIKFLVIRLFNSQFIFLIIIYALLGVSLKFYGIIKISEFWFFSLLIYVSNIFIIHDMTQIRAGVCASILLISIIPLRNKNPLGFFSLATLACLFHFSGLIVFFLWFLDADKLNRKVWALIIPICYIAFLSHLNFSMLSRLIPIPSVQAKLNVYFMLQNSGSAVKVNVFSLFIMIRLVLVYLFMYKIDFLYSKNPYAILVLKIYLLSIGITIIAADLSALAFRLSDLLSITEIVVIPFLIYMFKPKIVGELLVVLFAVMLIFFHFRAHTLLIF
jgi:hypothetical protein